MQPSIYWIPDQLCGPLAIIGRPRGGEWLEDELMALREQGFSTIVSLLKPAEVLRLGLEREESACLALGMQLVSFPVYDRDTPDSLLKTAELVTILRERLSRGQAVGIHCRSSIGRSSVLAACILVGSGTTPSAAFELISEARGVEVPDTKAQQAWVQRYSEWERNASVLVSEWT